MGDQTRKEDRKVRCVEFWETQLDFCVVSMREYMLVMNAINGTRLLCVELWRSGSVGGQHNLLED